MLQTRTSCSSPRPACSCCKRSLSAVLTTSLLHQTLMRFQMSPSLGSLRLWWRPRWAPLPVACLQLSLMPHLAESLRPRCGLGLLLQKAGQTEDHTSLLVPSADIFHPTSFPLLSSLYEWAAGGLRASSVFMIAIMTRMSRACCPAGPGGQTSWQSSASFMQQHANTRATQTRNAYNPLLHDFSNTSIFVGQSA